MRLVRLLYSDSAVFFESQIEDFSTKDEKETDAFFFVCVELRRKIGIPDLGPSTLSSIVLWSLLYVWDLRRLLLVPSEAATSTSRGCS